MRLLKEALGILGALVVLMVIVAFVSPKAARGVAAALVQVVNTPTTAVPTVAAPAATQIYNSQCQSSDVASVSSFSYLYCTFSPAIPAGQTLFIQTMSILTNSTGGDPEAGWISSSTEPLYLPQLYIPLVREATSAAGDFWAGALGGSFAVPGPASPSCVAFMNANVSGSVSCVITGYLAPAQ